ncbi:cytochrome P450 [Bowmanella dokdonensis]|uniref:Cytochrome P450 n=1 Tax=Bowmanella dokdonensis TaxID=751969 RepID=A0A939DKT8_9ALTE|nr:cytochrome P450 [Bowmanella dokdonensis]MBN7824333.1 cytochrome P450 [Bowmanella dokdonensis]
MPPTIPQWQPLSKNAQQDQLASYDAQRRQCPVAHSETLHYSVLSHDLASEVLSDYRCFSNQAGGHLSVPNGMDPPLHGVFRPVIEPYFSAEAMARFRPLCADICQQLVSELKKGQEIDVIGQIAEPFSLQIQCAFMGWPDSLQTPLRDWLKANQQAIQVQDRTRLTQLANAFDAYIQEQLTLRRQRNYKPGVYDTTWKLLQDHVQVNGERRLLSDTELVSIIRNWTVGELGTIAASVGIICCFLARHPALQQTLREQPALLGNGIDEILRIDPPLIANRRKTTMPVMLGGFAIPEGAQITLLWAAANRDQHVFGQDNGYAPEQNKADNLLYGAGIHQCPGAPLARMELVMLTEQLLSQTSKWQLGRTKRAVYPAGGYQRLYLRFD